MADGREIIFPSEVGLAKGAEGPGVEELQRYLSRFGYIKPYEAGAYAGILREAPIPDVAVGTFDEATVDALKLYQGFHNLPPTGELDEATVAQMSIPRCGFPDINDIAGADRFVVQGNRWNTTPLNYGFEEFSPDLTREQIRDAVTEAFRLWSDVTPLTFSEISVGLNPEIRIRFVAGNHGDGTPFDGVGGVLAHAFPPPGTGVPTSIGGDSHFDEAETWDVTLPIPENRFDLVMLAAHEFGHALGLLHETTVPGAIMRPFFEDGTSQRIPHSDDINGIQTIYGANPGGVRIIPDVLNFGNVPAGEHFDRSFTVGNKEPNAITVTFPRLRPEPHEGGALFWEPGSIVIPPGRHETVSLQFFPRETGVFQATLRFTSNGPGSPHPIRVRALVSGPPP